MHDYEVVIEFDGKDLMQVIELRYWNEDEDDWAVDQAATDACFNLTTCSDSDYESTLQQMVKHNLTRDGIEFGKLFLIQEQA